MPTGISAGLTDKLQQLLDERQQHADALARIDETLGQIHSALGSSPNGRRLGRPPGRPSFSVATNGATPKKRRRGRGSYATTAEEFVLSFIRSNKNPTSRDINGAWKEEGRGHTAANTLGKLVKDKKLKRTPLGGGLKGSRYSLV